MLGKLTRLLICALAVAVPPAAQAGSRLDEAVDLWLQGDDENSLPLLSELAAEGSADARLLLGRIETSDLGPSPYRQSLTRAQSRALFRMTDGSPFGRSWLWVEAKAGNTLAQALLQSNQPAPNPALITKLNRLGEHQATDHPTRIAALYGTQDMRDGLLSEQGMQADLQPYLRYLSGTPEPRGDGLAALRHIVPEAADEVDAGSQEALGMAGILALGLGFGDISPVNRWRPQVESWLMSAPAAKPVSSLCNTHCPDAAPACAFAFLALSGGYYETVRFDSPLEKLIPQDRFVNSPRARIMVLRKAVLARTETNLGWLADDTGVSAISACANQLIKEERRKYP